MFRDGILKSIWQAEITLTRNNVLRNDFYDVVIAGAGVSGLTCAVFLQKAGLKCIVLEAENIGFGTTGGTTAHLNTFFDASYDEVIRDFGLSNAQLLAEAGKLAIDIIRSNVSQYDIQCDFEEKTGFLFATDDQQVEELKKVQEGSAKAGVKMEYCDKTPFPIPFLKAVKIPGQAQFHPIKYIKGLQKVFVESGGELVDKCRVTDHRDDNGAIMISTTLGTVKARHLVYATHTPPGVNSLHFRNIPWRSYVLGVELQSDDYPDALGYDLADPYHYYRTHRVDGKNYLIAGGKDHKTGIQTDTRESLARLEAHVREHFDVKAIPFSWSSQFFEPVDGLPYIGRMPEETLDVYVCTGYNGNGMTFGTLAGKIISDLIVHNHSAYEALFSPGRIKPVAGFSGFVSHNANVAATWIKDQLSFRELEGLDDLDNDEGKVVEVNGRSYAVYKEATGILHVLSNTCTHAKCSVEWNSAEKTWDCPCHGSRFGIQGNVLTAPAVKGLEKKELNISPSEVEKQ